MHEYQGGVYAANKFLGERHNMSTAVCVIPEAGNLALDDRCKGFNATMSAAGVKVETIQVNGGNIPEMIESIESLLSGDVSDGDCAFDAILSSGSTPLKYILDTMASGGYYFDADGSQNYVGCFDTGTFIFDSLYQNTLLFTVDQQQYLQGYLPVALATLYVTTGMALTLPLDTDGVFMSGPALITIENPPTDTWQQCVSDGFPVCPNAKAPGGADAVCDCTDRASLTIGGVLHGVTTDPFWCVGLIPPTTSCSKSGICVVAACVVTGI